MRSPDTEWLEKRNRFIKHVKASSCHNVGDGKPTLLTIYTHYPNYLKPRPNEADTSFIKMSRHILISEAKTAQYAGTEILYKAHNDKLDGAVSSRDSYNNIYYNKGNCGPNEEVVLKNNDAGLVKKNVITFRVWAK